MALFIYLYNIQNSPVAQENLTVGTYIIFIIVQNKYKFDNQSI